MLKQQPRILTATESAFAAKHFTQVYLFLNENNLSEDDYYDSAINGFLKAVQEYNTSADFGDFKEFAEACMKAECTAYKEKLSRTPTVLSISECYNSANELEDTIADVKNTMDEAISAICLEETMQCFDAILIYHRIQVCQPKVLLYENNTVHLEDKLLEDYCKLFQAN